ncbi:MAG: MBL fold metallo-hydrolase [Bacteroidales bacterium]|nr:MBL fold metallo-hydrolase [Bacteroidales bacterium]
MINIHRFTFNDFQVNTYLLWDDTKECVIVDAACFTEEEQKELISFIQNADLKPVKIVNTHNHIDHILGNPFVKKQYNIPLYANNKGDLFIRMAQSSGTIFGLEVKEVAQPDHNIDEGDMLTFGNSGLKVLYTPGHADGSICLYASEEKFLIAGDVLFAGGIGRTDLPTGDFDTLAKNISQKLYALSDNVRVFPGHGPETTIGEEKRTILL